MPSGTWSSQFGSLRCRVQRTAIRAGAVSLDFVAPVASGRDLPGSGKHRLGQLAVRHGRSKADLLLLVTFLYEQSHMIRCDARWVVSEDRGLGLCG